MLLINTYIHTYYSNLSEIVKRFLQKYKVRIVFRINSKLDNFMILDKDPYEIEEQNSVVYQISCKCGVLCRSKQASIED